MFTCTPRIGRTGNDLGVRPRRSAPPVHSVERRGPTNSPSTDAIPVAAGAGGAACPAGGERVVLVRPHRARTPRPGSAGSPCTGTGSRSAHAGRTHWHRARGRPHHTHVPVGSTPPPCCRRSPACRIRTASHRGPPSPAAPGAAQPANPALRRDHLLPVQRRDRQQARVHRRPLGLRVSMPGRATITEHAPHSPSAHPSLAPVRPRSRSQSSTVVWTGRRRSGSSSPFTFRRAEDVVIGWCSIGRVRCGSGWRRRRSRRTGSRRSSRSRAARRRAPGSRSCRAVRGPARRCGRTTRRRAR